MDSGATSASITGQAKKVEKTRRTWTALEEKALIVALKEAITKGWKSENGFKAGYLQFLEDALKSVFPETDLQGNPHINSKIHVWKKTHGSLATMLCKSGVGWNDSDNMIEATSETWEAVNKADKNCRLLRYKRWPLYPDWCEIFGNDKATREGVETFAAAVQDVLNMAYEVSNNAEKGTGHEVSNNAENGLDDLLQVGEGAGESNSVSLTPSSTLNAGTKPKCKKRKQVAETDDLIIGAINNLAEITKTSMSNLIRELASGSNIADPTDSVLDTLATISDLSSDKRIRVAEFLVENPNKLPLFLKLSVADRLSFIERIINP